MSNSRATSQRFRILLFSCPQPRVSSSLVPSMETPISGKWPSECRGSRGRIRRSLHECLQSNFVLEICLRNWGRSVRQRSVALRFLIGLLDRNGLRTRLEPRTFVNLLSLARCSLEQTRDARPIGIKTHGWDIESIQDRLSTSRKYPRPNATEPNTDPQPTNVIIQLRDLRRAQNLITCFCE